MAKSYFILTFQFDTKALFFWSTFYFASSSFLTIVMVFMVSGVIPLELWIGIEIVLDSSESDSPLLTGSALEALIAKSLEERLIIIDFLFLGAPFFAEDIAFAFFSFTEGLPFAFFGLEEVLCDDLDLFLGLLLKVANFEFFLELLGKAFLPFSFLEWG